MNHVTHDHERVDRIDRRDLFPLPYKCLAPVPKSCILLLPSPLWAVSMSTLTKVSPLRRLVNILSDTVTRIDEKYASANLEFPALDKPFHEEDPGWQLLSNPDVAPLASVIVAAADQLIVSARSPVHAILDMAQAVRTFVNPSLPTVDAGGYD